MKFLREALKGISRLDSETPTNSREPEHDFDLDAEYSSDLSDEDLNLDGEDTEGEPSEDDHDLEGVVDKATEDPNKRGLIRTVKKAHLVYKRETEDGTFEELWVMNVNKLKDDLAVRKAILAGTDIPSGATKSQDDGTGNVQEYTLWTAGNVEFIKITGLVN
jgi:hypothetical protein